MSAPDWHEVRRTVFTGSEIAGLGGLSKFATPWTLHGRKAGTLPPLAASEAMVWGTLLEPAVLRHPAVVKAFRFIGWEHGPNVAGAPCEFIETTKDGTTIQVAVNVALGLGGTPDATGVVDGTTVLGEVKTVGSRAFDDWEPCEIPPALPELQRYAPTRLLPDSYLIQIQTYLGLLGLRDGFALVLVGGQKLEIHRIEFDAEVFEALSAHALSALQNIANGVEPPFDPYLDGANLGPWLAGRTLRPEKVPLTDPELIRLAVEADAFGRIMKVADRERKARSAQLGHALGLAGLGRVIIPGVGSGGIVNVKAKPERVEIRKAEPANAYFRIWPNKTLDASEAIAAAAQMCQLPASAGEDDDE